MKYFSDYAGHMVGQMTQITALDGMRLLVKQIRAIKEAGIKKQDFAAYLELMIEQQNEFEKFKSRAADENILDKDEYVTLTTALEIIFAGEEKMMPAEQPSDADLERARKLEEEWEKAQALAPFEEASRQVKLISERLEQRVINLSKKMGQTL